MLQTYKKRTT